MTIQDGRSGEDENPLAVAENWTVDDLRAELDRFKHELRAAGLMESTVFSYLSGSSMFVRWLDGDYAPRGSR